LDADQIAKDTGNARASNIVMLGAAAPFLGLSIEDLEGGIKAFLVVKAKRLLK
jgi:indolepyruvate ferredoxin oxidoreductase, beta subunit